MNRSHPTTDWLAQPCCGGWLRSSASPSRAAMKLISSVFLMVHTVVNEAWKNHTSSSTCVTPALTAKTYWWRRASEKLCSVDRPCILDQSSCCCHDVVSARGAEQTFPKRKVPNQDTHGSSLLQPCSIAHEKRKDAERFPGHRLH